MAKKLGTQDKVKARALRQRLLASARVFDDSDDLGDRGDRYGPELTRLANELAALEGWEGRL